MHSISIKREGIERRKKSTGLLHILAGLFLLVNTIAYYKKIGYENSFSLLPIFLISLLSLGYGMFRTALDPLALYNHWLRMLQFLAFAVLGISMMNENLEIIPYSLFLWAIICIPLLFTERKIFHDARLRFGPKYITIPGYFSNRVVPWSEVSDINIRPDFVTIHYPGNKFVQFEVMHDLPGSEIEKINQFCQQKIQQLPTGA